MFWWWEFQLSTVEWSLTIYFVLIIYATLLFFISLVVQPGELVGVGSYKEYYYLNRHWLFGLLIAITLWDFVDTYSKGATHISELGAIYLLVQFGTIIGCAFAIATQNETYHKIFATMWIFVLIANMVRLFFVIT
jgi:hypothetical protein